MMDMRGLSPMGLHQALGDQLARRATSSIVSLSHWSGVVGEAAEWDVVVDASMTQLMARIEGPSSMKVSLVDAAGNEVAPTWRRPGLFDFSIPGPRVGKWRFKCTGARGSLVSANVQANAGLAVQVEVMQGVAGLAGAFEWQRLIGQPLVGERHMLLIRIQKGANMVTNLSRLRVGLASTTGSMRWVDARRNQGIHDGSPLAAEVTFQTGDRVVVSGSYGNDESFQRELTSIQPSQFGVTLVEGRGGTAVLDELLFVPTRWRAFRVRVTRRGGSGPVVVAPSLGQNAQTALEMRAEPSQFVLRDGESREVRLLVRGSASPTVDIGPMESANVLAVGEVPNDPRGNYLAFNGRMGRDSDGDGVSDFDEQHFGQSFDGDRDGTADAQQSTAIGIRLQGSGFTLKFGPSAGLGRFDPFVLLGKDLPEDYWAPRGAVTIGIPQNTKVKPNAFQLFIGSDPLYGFHQVAILDPVSRTWGIRGTWEPTTRVMTVSLSVAEQRQLATEGLSIAPVVSR